MFNLIKNLIFQKQMNFYIYTKINFVGKFFKDKKLLKEDLKRGELLHKVTPELIGYKVDNFYFYKWEEGKTLYEKCDPKLLKIFNFRKKYL